MAFASHTAQRHKISATQYWREYGFHDDLDVDDKDKPEKVVFT